MDQETSVWSLELLLAILVGGGAGPQKQILDMHRTGLGGLLVLPRSGMCVCVHMCIGDADMTSSVHHGHVCNKFVCVTSASMHVSPPLLGGWMPTACVLLVWTGGRPVS